MAKKILVVEDDSNLAGSLSKTLTSGGFDVFVANDGESGFKTAQEKNPDLIILDLILPKKHGFKVMEDLKSRPELSSIPVIVLTNLETSHDIERASTLGVKAYLVKANYSLKEILKRVKEVVDEN